MRILHTSDWHLGHTLHDFSREREHQAFLDWLCVDVLAKKEVDALVVCGDIFDASNPPPHAQRQWYQFLMRAWRELPRLHVVVVGGNHDSAGRLDAPRPLLEELQRLHVVGGVPRDGQGELELDRLLVPLEHPSGARTWVAAVPYLRPSDVPGVPDAVAAARDVYGRVGHALQQRCRPGDALLATGHCYTVGGELSELSERKIQAGNQQALPADVFPAECSYVALGHLHLPQSVRGRQGAHYSGAPLALSMDEARYHHRVNLVEFSGGALKDVEHVQVPRLVPLLRIPEKGAAELKDLLAKLEELPPAQDGEDRSLWPFLEVAVQLLRPEPGLRQMVAQKVEGRAVRLVRIAQVRQQGEVPQAVAGQRLEDISPGAVFDMAWRRQWHTSPPEAERHAFDQLVEWAGHPEDAEKRRHAHLEPVKA